MMRLIDADILLGYVNKYDTGGPIGKALRAMLEKSPIVDAVPVVRCKDCKHSDAYNHCTRLSIWNKPEDFCSYAERKEHETD